MQFVSWMSAPLKKRQLSETESRILLVYSVEGGRTEKEALKVTENKPKKRWHREIRKDLEDSEFLKRVPPVRGRAGKWTAVNEVGNVNVRTWLDEYGLKRILDAFEKMAIYREDGSDHEARKIADDIIPVLREIKKNDESFPYSESMHSKLIYPPRVIVVRKKVDPGNQQAAVLNDQSEAWLKWSQKVNQYCKKKLQR